MATSTHANTLRKLLLMTYRYYLILISLNPHSIHSAYFLISLIFNICSIVLQHSDPFVASLDLLLKIADQRIDHLILLHNNIAHTDKSLIQSHIGLILCYFHLGYAIGKEDMSLVYAVEKLICLV